VCRFYEDEPLTNPIRIGSEHHMHQRLWASNRQSEGLRSLYGGEWFLFFIMGRSCRLSKAACEDDGGMM